MRISDWSSDVCSSDLGRGRAFLERRVERDLGILLVEDILRPEFDAPFLVGSAHAEARVEQRIAVLRLLREQVRPGVVIAGHAAIDIDEAGQPAAADVGGPGDAAGRSEEHTSELQSLMRISYAVFCLKKKIPRQLTERDNT